MATSRNQSSQPGRVMIHAAGVVLFFFVITGSRDALGQRIDFTYETYGLEVDDDNVIHNAAHLENFLEKLYRLRHTREGRVNVVHIGDSHIQADYMTSIIRRAFHRDFGNAGRGLIVPLRVAGTNEPNNFKTSSNTSWRSKRCVFPSQSLLIGIGGVTIETTDPAANLEIYMNDLWLDYSFNALTLFYEKDAVSFDFSICDMQGRELARIEAESEDSLTNYSRAEWDERVNAINIRSIRNRDAQTRAMIYGAVVDNSDAGVLYHTVGVNGAQYKHYQVAKYFAAQTAALNTDLFIISLGTNEAIGYPYVDKTLSSHIGNLLATLLRNNPDAAFILVTPQDVFRRRNKPNPGIREVRDGIIRYAVENGLAFYDMYRALGGEHSAQAWTDNALLSRDGVHLTRAGYEYQGNLFYHALMKSYNQYVPNRHP